MRVVVIGAGFAGLVAAEELNRAGVQATVLEARDRVGGRVWSQAMAGGATIERGAEFILPEHTAIRSIVKRLGLSLSIKGTTYGDREPRGGLVVSRRELLAAYATVRAAAVRGRLTGSVVDALASLDMSEGAREAIRSRIEVSTAYPAEDQEAAVLAESGTGVGDFATHSVAGGNQSLALTLAARLGSAVHLRSPATRVAWSRTGVVVSSVSGDVDADAAIVAAPASVIERIAFAPPLPDGKTRALASVRYGHAAKLFLPLRRTVAPSATLHVPGRYWTFTQLAPDGSLLPVAASFAGTLSALERLGVNAGSRVWLASVRALRPDLEVDPVGAILSAWSHDPWVKAAYSARSRASPMDDPTLRAPVATVHFAGEHTAGELHAQMEGAVRSGLRAAAELLGASRE